MNLGLATDTVGEVSPIFLGLVPLSRMSNMGDTPKEQDLTRVIEPVVLL